MIYISQNKSFFPHHIHQMHLHSPSQCYYPLHHIAKSSHNWHLLHVHEETREKKLKVKCQTCGPIFLGNVWRKKKKNSWTCRSKVSSKNPIYAHMSMFDSYNLYDSYDMHVCIVWFINMSDTHLRYNTFCNSIRSVQHISHIIRY